MALIACSAWLHGAEDNPADSQSPTTPPNLQDAQRITYRNVNQIALPLYVLKPKSVSSQSPAVVIFFGGGWQKGDPGAANPLARHFTKLGYVVILPDYRTGERYHSQPLDSVADARAALRWIQGHADELNIDPNRILAAGMSAGGHLALWTAIPDAPAGLKGGPDGLPSIPPQGLVLLFPVSDTTANGYAQGFQRFGPKVGELSVLDHLPAKMPPTLILHGTADQLVPLQNSQALQGLLAKNGNPSELVDLPGKGHGVKGTEEWQAIFPPIETFLKKEGFSN